MVKGGRSAILRIEDNKRDPTECVVTTAAQKVEGMGLRGGGIREEAEGYSSERKKTK